MATVFHVIDRRTNLEMAVKVVSRSKICDSTLQKCIQYEVQALENLSHPRLLHCYRIHADFDNVYMATELCTGGDLFSLLEYTDEAIAESTVVLYIRDVLLALGYMHERGYAHRDVKPENIFLCADGTVRLGDFGIVFYNPPSEGKVSTTHPCGSPEYVAPEVLSGRSYVPSVADMWSTGVTMYALLTKTLPFTGETIDDIYYKVMDMHPKRFFRKEKFKGVSRGTIRLMRRLMSLNVDDRPTAGEGVRMCEDVLRKLCSREV